uniref:K Homology domain-containing protein n=1 Tax=Oryza nivara TaxID=4536 RepID=A0A0E0IS27_ORYNI
MRDVDGGGKRGTSTAEASSRSSDSLGGVRAIVSAGGGTGGGDNTSSTAPPLPSPFRPLCAAAASRKAHFQQGPFILFSVSFLRSVPRSGHQNPSSSSSPHKTPLSLLRPRRVAVAIAPPPPPPPTPATRNAGMNSYCDKKEVTVAFSKTKRQEEDEVIWRMVEQGATDDEECGGTNCSAGENRDPGWPGTSVFRMLIPATKVGAVIGHSGERLRRLCEETKACVRVIGGHFAAAERAVIIFAKEQPDEPKPPAIDALLRVYECTINDDGLDVRYNNIVVARILTPSEQAASLIGDQGSVINYIKKASKTNIHVIDGDLPPVALEDDMIIEIWGLPARVHQALELVACHLRKYLVHRSVIPLFDPHVSIPISPVDMPPFHYSDHHEGLLHEASPGYYSLYSEAFQLEHPWTDTSYSRYPMENFTHADIFEYRQEAPVFFGRYRSVTPPHYGHEAEAYLSSPMELCLHNNLNTYGWQATPPIGRSDTVERIRSLISVYGKQAHPHPLRQTYQSTKMEKRPHSGISLYRRDDHPTRVSPSPATELPPSPAVSAYKWQVSPSLKMYPSTNVENLQHCRVSACAPEELPNVVVPSLTSQSPAVTSQVIMKMQVPIFYAEAVIGPTGARIDYIRQASGSSVVIKDLDDSAMSIEITGSAATDVQIAEQLIKNFMAEAAAASPDHSYDFIPSHLPAPRSPEPDIPTTSLTRRASYIGVFLQERWALAAPTLHPFTF